MSKILITIGILFIVAGFCWPLIDKLNLGRLPGDLFFKSGNMKFYFPLTTCILISVLLTILFYIFRK